MVIRDRSGGIAAVGTGSGTYRWSTWTGTHSYVVRATDSAGNASGPSSVTITADATPPSLTGVQVARGSRFDSRSRLTFVTDAGTGYRLFVDGRQVRHRVEPDTRVATFLDVADGRHRVRIEARDPFGNLRTWAGGFGVNVPRLAVSATELSSPTHRVQRFRVVSSPTATRAFVRVPGGGRASYRFIHGGVTVKVPLPDGTYRGATIAVRDARGRSGSLTLPALRVDTKAPPLTVRPDQSAADEGMLRAAVVTEPDADVSWRLIGASGDVVATGKLVAEGRAALIERDVPKGSYRLVVSATDRFDHTTTTRASTRVADEPWPPAVVALVVLALCGLGIGAVVLAATRLRRWRPVVGRWARARPAAWRAGAQSVLGRRRTTSGQGQPAADVPALFVPRQRVGDEPVQPADPERSPVSAGRHQRWDESVP